MSSTDCAGVGCQQLLRFMLRSLIGWNKICNQGLIKRRYPFKDGSAAAAAAAAAVCGRVDPNSHMASHHHLVNCQARQVY